jgi:dienelactone hydrolase
MNHTRERNYCAFAPVIAWPVYLSCSWRTILSTKMKKMALCLTIIASGFYPSATAQIVQDFKTTTTSVIGYIEYIPKDYYSNTHKYPVVIFLHGLGQRGPNSTDPAILESAYDNLVMYGPPMHVKQGKQFPFILISPQLKNIFGDWPGWYIMEVIEHVKTYLRIDPKRIYLTGSSLGGGGTWIGGQESPDYYACLAPVMGSTNDTRKACLIAGSNLPVWAFHSDDDTVVPYSKSVNMVNAINACNPPIQAQLKTYTGVGHNAYTLAYDIGYTYQTPNIYDWMMQWVNDHSNKVPKADAGPEQSVILPATSLTITGTGTDTDGSILQYNWVQIAGAPAILTNAGTNRVTVSSLLAGIYAFRLVVKDDKGSIASDDVNVYVKTSVNTLPVAKAGSDKTVNLPANNITLLGSGTDIDGYIVSYTWTKIAGGTATLTGTSTTNLTASNMVAGTYTFRLTVKDDSGGTSSDDVNVYVNYLPAANAGPDKSITLPTNSVTLIGSGSDSDGTISSYSWSKVSGGTASLSGTSTANLTASNLLEGEYVFRLTVKDNRGGTKTDDAKVIVSPAIGSNVAPTVSAGSDRVISTPTSSISITATATDSDGTIAKYTWIKLSGGTASLSGTSTATLTASSLAAGEYVFQITVMDDDGASKSDEVKVTVNKSPVVNAGSDKQINLPTTSLTIYGSASDADGTISTYAWTKISGGAATMSGITTKTLYVSGLAAGIYVFRLAAKDNRGAATSDDMTVVVNIPPISNAGANQYLTLPANSVTLYGTGTDSDGTIASYTWTKTAGGAATMSGASTSNLALTGLEAGTYSFRLSVKDNRGSSNYDDVTVLVNIPPVANAGPDKTLILPSNATNLAGSGSDADGTISSYSWMKVSGGTAYMSGNSTSTLSITGLTAGTYIFRLTVRDNRGAQKSDDVTVIVTSSTSGSAFSAAIVDESGTISSQDFTGSSFYPPECSECKVMVFNDRLVKVYDGAWTEGADGQVFSGRGMYFFRVVRDGRVVDSGKIYRQ